LKKSLNYIFEEFIETTPVTKAILKKLGLGLDNPVMPEFIVKQPLPGDNGRHIWIPDSSATQWYQNIALKRDK
jgi:hypothetical protein